MALILRVASNVALFILFNDLSSKTIFLKLIVQSFLNCVCESFESFLSVCVMNLAVTRVSNWMTQDRPKLPWAG